MDFFQQVERDLQGLRRFIEFIFRHGSHAADLLHHLAHVPHRLNHIAGAGFAFGPDHCRTFRDPAQRLAKIPGSTDKGDLERLFINVINIIRRAQHFAFINVVDPDRFEDPGFGNVSDPALRHDGDGYRLLDPADHTGITHAGNTARRPDVCGDPFQRHHGTRTGIFRDFCLFGRGHIHDHAAFEHFCEVTIQFILCTFHFSLLICLFRFFYDTMRRA